jgi:hypothetical protein
MTRTSTDHSVHKALNLDRLTLVRLAESKSSKLRDSADRLEGSDGVDVVTSVVTAYRIGAFALVATATADRDVLRAP